jgi:hypothetical protein
MIPDWSPEDPSVGRNFSIPPDQWPQIEKNYRLEIPLAARQEIEESMRSY